MPGKENLPFNKIKIKQFYIGLVVITLIEIALSREKRGIVSTCSILSTLELLD